MIARTSTASKLMGLWSATSIGVGARIGAVLFALVGMAIAYLGSIGTTLSNTIEILNRPGFNQGFP